jgi:hypothetical protein
MGLNYMLFLVIINTILREPYVQFLAEQLRRAISQAQTLNEEIYDDNYLR